MNNLIIDKEYKNWLANIKLKVRNAQIKAALKVNTELLQLYWEIGADYAFCQPFNEDNVDEFRQQVVAQIIQLPWGHNIIIITKCNDIKEALYYVQNTIIYNWSRNVLIHQIESRLYEREGKAEIPDRLKTG